MQNRQTYEYAIIRLVPKVERGECINIGVILFSKKLDYLDMKIYLDEKRINTFSETVDLEEIQTYLDAWRSVCAGGAPAGKIGALSLPERFRWLTAARSTIIQSSEVHPGITDNPQEELNKLFKNLVA